VYSLSQGTFAVLAAKFRHQLVCRGAPRTPVTPLEQPQSAGVGGERVNRRRVGGVDSRHLRCRVDLTHTVTQHTSTPPTYQCTIIPQTRPYTASERAAPWLHCTAVCGIFRVRQTALSPDSYPHPPGRTSATLFLRVLSSRVIRSTQPCIPPGSLNRVPALLG